MIFVACFSAATSLFWTRSAPRRRLMEGWLYPSAVVAYCLVSLPGALPAVERQPPGAVVLVDQPRRDWADCFGNTAEGWLTGVYGATVFLSDGENLSLPLVTLSDGDREYVRSQLQAVGEGDAFPGAVDRRDTAATMKLSLSSWHRQVERWAKAVTDNSPEEAAQAIIAWNHLRAIRDPQALKGLSRLATRATNESVRMACVEGLASIGSKEAIQVLVEISVTHRSGLVRAMATWLVSRADAPATVLEEYVTYLRAPKFREMALLNLHATGLVHPSGQNDVPNMELVDALIEMLVVKQTRYVPYTEWSYTRDGSWSNSRRLPSGRILRNPAYGLNKKWRFRTSRRIARIEVPVPGDLSRKLLTQYTGRDFGYNRQAWGKWKQSQSRSQ